MADFTVIVSDEVTRVVAVGAYGPGGDGGGGGGDVATDAIWDAKGDLAAGTGANTAAKVTLGSNGHVLTADSAEVTGVKWAAPAASGAPTDATYVTLSSNGTLTNERTLTAGTGITLTDEGAGSTVTVAATGGSLDGFTGNRSGVWYIPLANVVSAFSATAGTHGQAVAMPILLRAGTLDRIAVNHNNTVTANETARLGIYSDDGNGYPGTLLLDAGTVDLGTATALKPITISQVVTTGIYWLVVARQGTAGTATAQLVNYGTSSTNTNMAMAVNLPSDQTDLFSTGRIALTMTGVTGALGAWSATPAITARGFVIGVRYA
jgi:hypothetical protein